MKEYGCITMTICKKVECHPLTPPTHKHLGKHVNGCVLFGLQGHLDGCGGLLGKHKTALPRKHLFRKHHCPPQQGAAGGQQDQGDVVVSWFDLHHKLQRCVGRDVQATLCCFAKTWRWVGEETTVWNVGWVKWIWMAQWRLSGDNACLLWAYICSSTHTNHLRDQSSTKHAHPSHTNSIAILIGMQLIQQLLLDLFQILQLHSQCCCF